MIKKRRPATSGQEREALIKMAADESELSRKTGNYKEQSTAGVSARAKKYIEPVVETALTVMPLGGTVIGAAKMIPTIVKGAAAAAAKRAAAAEAKRKAAAEAKRKAAAEAKRKAEKKLQEENIYEESTRRVDPIPPTSGAGRPSSPGGVQKQNLDLQPRKT
jgi:colicin import membrane protein